MAQASKGFFMDILSQKPIISLALEKWGKDTHTGYRERLLILVLLVSLSLGILRGIQSKPAAALDSGRHKGRK